MQINWRLHNPSDGSRLMTLEEYRDDVEIGNIKYGDGHGFAVSYDQVSDVKVEGVTHDVVPITATHVAWYVN